MKLDIACGSRKVPGCVGIDVARLPGVDIVHDLRNYPWPVESDSVDEACCCHYFEHVPAGERVAFLNEVWRVLKPDAGITLITPLGLFRQCQDFTHEWPPIVPASYLYFNAAWREREGIAHYRELYGIACDFAIHDARIALARPFENRDETEAEHAAQHVLNAADDLIVVLRKQCLPPASS